MTGVAEISTDIETTVNLSGDRADLRPQILLHHPQRMAIIICDQVHCQSQVTKPSRSSNAVQVRLGILGEVKINDNIYALNIDTAREEIGSNKVAGSPIAEFVEDPVAICLLHFGMYVEAGVSKLRDFLGEELNAIDRVAEDDGLVNLQLGEEGVEAVDLLAFFDVGVELGDTPQGELFHQVDGIGFGNVLLAEFFDGHWEGGAE
mmetsp:Transcript_2510/g.4648  ORF Transcript_2510/g.4648 Transcript_2510/m.4648 type:complete len:205 (-) Transcript_2510:386-1000(-)